MATVSKGGVLSCWYTGSARTWTSSTQAYSTSSSLNTYIGYYSIPYVTCIKFTVSASGTYVFTLSNLRGERQATSWPKTGYARWFVSTTPLSASVYTPSSVTSRTIAEQTIYWSNSTLDWFYLNSSSAKAYFSSSNTYYLWIYDSSSSDGRLEIYRPYSTVSLTLTNATLTTVNPGAYFNPSASGGRYSGASIIVPGYSGYSYVYVGWADGGAYWKSSTVSDSQITRSLDANSSYTSGYTTAYVFRASSDLGTSVSGTPAAQCTVKVPALVCYVYWGESSKSQMTSIDSWTNISVSGWTFNGISTSSTAKSGTTYSSWSTALNGNTYYATYYQSISISYNANGGSGAPSASSGTRYLYGTGSTSNPSITLSSTVPTRSGYKFRGWSTSSSATSASYSAGSAYTFSASKTLYAVWKPTFSWTGLYASEANTFRSYVHSYVGTTSAPTLSSGDTINATWYNYMANKLGVSTVSAGTTITQTQLTALATAYNNK